MSDVMMSLGYFQFSISTAAYQQLRKSKEWRWPGQAQIGQNDAHQFTGHTQTIELSGVIYPHHLGGFGQLKRLERMGDLAVPQILVDGTGYFHGLFVMTKLDEGQVVIAARGRPKKQQFLIGLQRYDGGIRSILSFF